jgi:hypothetical protein
VGAKIVILFENGINLPFLLLIIGEKGSFCGISAVKKPLYQMVEKRNRFFCSSLVFM